MCLQCQQHNKHPKSSFGYTALVSLVTLGISFPAYNQVSLSSQGSADDLSDIGTLLCSVVSEDSAAVFYCARLILFVSLNHEDKCSDSG